MSPEGSNVRMIPRTSGEIEARTKVCQSVLNFVRRVTYGPDEIKSDSFFSVRIWKYIASVFRRLTSAGESRLVAKAAILETVREAEPPPLSPNFHLSHT